MTATSPPSPPRHARRLGIAAVCIGALALTGTSTLAFADGSRPAESTAASSVVGLREGDSGATVQAVQQKLIGFGYYVAGGADGHFGPGTTAALRVFQQQNRLNPTGVVTENTARYLGLAAGVSAGATQATPQAAGATATPAALAAPSGSVVGLRQGMTGATVRQLQLAILATGLYVNGGADGTFGPSTHRGVTLVQRVNGLPETGVVDAATASALGLTGSASSPSTPAPAGTVAPQATAPSYVGLGFGSTGPVVTKLQQALMATGLVVRGGADGIFGQHTRRALRVVYQRVNGLQQTGVVDETTARLLGLLAPDVGSNPAGATAPAPSGGGSTPADFPKYDERGARVVALQRALLQAGISFSGGADGIFGSATAGAVMKFQQARGLRVTGKVDQATAAALGLQAAPTPAPAPVVNVTLQAKPLAKGPCWYGDTWQATRGSGRVHLGVDIGAPAGTPLQAVAAGRISQVYRDRPGSLAGNGLKIRTADGTYYFYGHLASIAPGIDLGVPVNAGQTIGVIGSTGNAAITHLHLEVHPRGGAAVNPFPYVRAIGAC